MMTLMVDQASQAMCDAVDHIAMKPGKDMSTWRHPMSEGMTMDGSRAGRRNSRTKMVAAGLIG